MKPHILLMTVLGLLATHEASAGVPAWCGSDKYEANNEDLNQLSSSKDPRDLVPTIVNILCTQNPDIEPHRKEVEAARQAWGKKLGMRDVDWADAVAWFRDTSHVFKADLSTKDLAKLTPIDQYEAIGNAFGTGSDSDPLYGADVLEQHLTDTGRMAFIDWCLKNDSVTRADGNITKWALCWPDIEKFDVTKIYAEIATDTVHDGVAKMWLRFHAHDVPAAIKDIANQKAALIKKDDTFKKVFETAAAARVDWTKTLGANAKLLELALAMDAGAIFHSRKLLDGCEPRTEAALAEAISTIPAKSFGGMHDGRDISFKGFAESAAPLLVNTPVVNVAGIAYAECHQTTSTSDYLRTFLQYVPGSRGPRSAALGVVMGATFTFDDLNASKLQFPQFGSRPYGRSGGAPFSSGGVVKSVKKDKDSLVVALEKTTMKQQDCVKEHRTNHVARIRTDGSLDYELICDKFEMVTHDTTGPDVHIRPVFEKLLKKGVLFTAYQGDVLAVWPSKTTNLPSVVLGGAVK